MKMLKTAPFVEIQYHDFVTTKDYTIVVSNSVDITGLNNAMPDWYVTRSSHLPESYDLDKHQACLSIAYPEPSLTRMSNGRYVSTILFVLPDGMLFCSRGGNLTHPCWTGCLVPGYRDIVYGICRKYGVPVSGVAASPMKSEVQSEPAGSPPFPDYE